MISPNNCRSMSTDPQPPSSTPTESLPTTDTGASDNVAIIAASVTAGVVGGLVVLAVVIATVALIVRRKKHKKTKPKLM